MNEWESYRCTSASNCNGRQSGGGNVRDERRGRGIGEREWVSMYDFVEIVRIPELLDYYRSQGMSFWKYVYCKNYALRNFFNFFTKILINGEDSGKQYVNFYKHFVKNLVYPYSWFSIIFFVFRSIDKVFRLK